MGFNSGFKGLRHIMSSANVEHSSILRRDSSLHLNLFTDWNNCSTCSV